MSDGASRRGSGRSAGPSRGARRAGAKGGSSLARGSLAALLRLAIGAALVAWVVAHADLRHVGEAFRGADARWIATAVVLLWPVGSVCSVRRWQLLLAAQGSRVPFATLLRAYSVGIFFNNLLPSSIGGDASRAAASWQAGVPRARAVAVVLVDRFLGLVVLVAFAALALLGGGGATPIGRLLRLPGVELVLLAAAIPAIAGTWLLFAPTGGLADRVVALGARLPGRAGAIAGRLAASARAFAGRWGVLAAALALSAGLQGAVLANTWMLCRALRLPIPASDLLLLVPVAVFVTSLPISVNGIGVRESVWVGFFHAYGLAPALALAYSWLEYGLVLGQALVGAAVWLAPRRIRERSDAVAVERDAELAEVAP